MVLTGSVAALNVIKSNEEATEINGRAGKWLDSRQ